MTSVAPPVEVTLRDVTLRDGLQDLPPVPTDVKVAIFETVRAAGVPAMELASFVRPDRVPAMADADDVVARTAAGAVARSALTLNAKGARRAIDAGVENLTFVISVSPPHQERNAGRSVDAACGELAAVVREAAGRATVELVAATAFGCPYTGAVEPAAVSDLIDRSLAAGVDAVTLADTVGTAVPREVGTLVGATVERLPGRAVGFHAHDTRGLGVANALSAIDAGARRVDGALGGLGGCPFAPGATGNVDLVDLAHAVQESGMTTGVDVDALATASREASRRLDRPLHGNVVTAGRRFA